MSSFRYLLLVFPLFLTFTVGCDGGGEPTVIAPSTEVSPSEAEIETEEYEKAMNNMQ